MNKKHRPRRLTDIVFLPWRMTDVLSRTRFDMRRALTAKNWGALKTAAQTCVDCAAKSECERWIANHEQGESNAVPSFCRNAHFIHANGPRPIRPVMRGATIARALLEAAPFEPARIEVLVRALNEAWLKIRTTVEPERIDDTWLSLAHAIVAHAGAGEFDGDTLTIAAIAAVQQHPPQARTEGPDLPCRSSDCSSG